jgi:3-deoxy-D-manno-octulosonic acid kinase
MPHARTHPVDQIQGDMNEEPHSAGLGRTPLPRRRLLRAGAFFRPGRPAQDGGSVIALDEPGGLRHYRRGGLRARLGGRESYLWLGEPRVRAWAEARVLDHLRRAGLRVPEPLGAIYWRGGASSFFYRNAILVARIAGAQALAGRLDQADPAAVARAIAAMHAAGVWHADLNAYNILFDADGQVWLIDFDRARLGVVSPEQAQKNRLRLRRSLVKVAGARGAQWWDALSRCLPS